MKIIFLDVETTGTEPDDRLVQLAYRIAGVGFESLFMPSKPMTVDAMSVCHITNEMLEGKEPFKDSVTYTFLKQLFEDPECVFVAHNAAFDMSFMAREGLPLPARHVCTMKISHHFDSKAELNRNNLQYLRYYYGLKFNQEINPHDAMSDVIVLEKLFEFYLQHYTLDELCEISAKPVLLKKMMFGKYKGQFIRDIGRKDIGYLDWMLREMQLDENLRHTVTYWLKKLNV